MIAQTVALLSERESRYGRVVVSAVFGCTLHGGAAGRSTNKDFVRTIMNPPRVPKGVTMSPQGASPFAAAEQRV